MKYSAEKKEEKKAKIKELRDKLKSLDDATRNDMLKNGHIMTIEGKSLSDKNTLLLLFQGVRDSIVGGYQQWKRAGRQVKKGEHGAVIWFPSNFKKVNDDGEESEGTSFFTGTVFAQSQTEELAAA